MKEERIDALYTELSYLLGIPKKEIRNRIESNSTQHVIEKAKQWLLTRMYRHVVWDSQDDVPSQYLVADSETDSVDAFINDFEEHMIN